MPPCQRAAVTPRAPVAVPRRGAGAGLAVGRIEEKLANEPGPPRPVEIPRPFRYRHIWYRALAILGLGRNDAGGFGVRVPIPPPPSRGGFH
jgi:hypothetical protein